MVQNEKSVYVTWQTRLAEAFAVLIPTLLAMVLTAVIRDYIRVPQEVDWGNAGEEQIVAYVVLFGGFGALLTYAFFIVPLVLLWPIRSQLKHCYALLLVSLTWLPLTFGVMGKARPVDTWREFLYPLHDDWGWRLEPFALFACSLYLLLLYRLDVMSRRTKRQV